MRIILKEKYCFLSISLIHECVIIKILISIDVRPNDFVV